MRDSHLPPSGPEGSDGGPAPEDDEPFSRGHLSPLGWGALVALVLAGVAVGWSWHAVADSIAEARPTGVLQGVALWFLAAGLFGVGGVTRRAVRSTSATLDPERMVNRLVLGRAGAVGGALLAGGYLGYALTWIGSHPDLRAERVGLALLASLGGLMVLVGGKFLERACRVPRA